MKYNYLENMIIDIDNYMNENYNMDDREGLPSYDELYDGLWVSDQVTGNASGSYTFNRWTAAEYVTDNTDLLQEAVKEFCVDASTLAEHLTDYEWQDVTIRCYLLDQALSKWLECNGIKLQ